MSSFNKQQFMDWLREEFPELMVFHFTYTLIENIIDYGIKHNHISKDQFCCFVADIIPEITFLEVANFCDDTILTRETLRQLNRL